MSVQYMRASRLSKCNCEKFVKNSYTTISLWQPINSKIPVLYTGFRICKNIYTLFGGFGCNEAICLKKVPKMHVFGLSPFWKFNFEKSKVSFCKAIGICEMWYDKMGPSLLWKIKSLLICWQSFVLYFEIKKKVSSKLQNLKKVFLSLYQFF